MRAIVRVFFYLELRSGAAAVPLPRFPATATQAAAHTPAPDPPERRRRGCAARSEGSVRQKHCFI